MKKYYFLLMIALVAMCVSCSKENDDVVPEDPKPVYKVRVANNISVANINNGNDGVLYDVCLGCSDGNTYRLGNIPSGNGVTFQVPYTKEGNHVVILFAKYGPNESEAIKSKYVAMLRSNNINDLAWKTLVDGEVVLFNITEMTYFAQTKSSSFDELVNYFKNVMAE